MRRSANVRWLVVVWALFFASQAIGSAEGLRLGSFEGTPITIDARTLFHTLGSDFFIMPDGTIYVQTGDIPAMWLRDAAAQTIPYIRFSDARPALRTWIRAVIEREVRNILIDPYANAFTARYRVWEHKWEVDSLAYPMLLTWAYYARTHDRRIFSRRLHAAMRRIVATYACEQEHAKCSHYRYPGTPTGGVPPTGMIWGAFRPSDDSVTYGFNIPQQMAALTALEDLGTLAITGFNDAQLAAQAAAMQVAISAGIDRYGMVYNFRFGWIYAFEVDGRGQTLEMDDANMPNLLSAPLFGFLRADDPRYLATRHFVLSKENPYYYEGKYASGLGSPHTPPGWIWPLGVIARGLTALTPSETLAALLTLSVTDGADGLIHESFDPNAFEHFTRADFGWGNAMYAELLFRSAAGFAGPALWPQNHTVVDRRMPQTPSVVGTFARIKNIAELISAFEQDVPMQALTTDADRE